MKKTIFVLESVVLEALGFLDEGEQITVSYVKKENEESVYSFTGKQWLMASLEEFLNNL